MYIDARIDGRVDACKDIKTRLIANGKRQDTIESKTKDTAIKQGKFQYAEHVFMTSDQYKALVDRFGRINTEKMVEKLDAYKASSGKKYVSDYHACLSWVVKEVVKDDHESRQFRKTVQGPMQ